MQQRNLIECTIDTAHPLPELCAVISAVVNTLPDMEARVSVLQTLLDEITTALCTVEEEVTREEAPEETDAASA